ncbi:MAG: VOC family protein [Labilithrix sp.]|nr:VOC family protein [Labilithrix sp.]
MSTAKHFIPDGSQQLMAQLIVKDAKKTAAFLADAFGGEKIAEYPGPDGKGVMWAMVKVGDSRILLADASGFATPTRANIFVYVPDVDAALGRARERGAKILQPAADMFWGDRWALVEDPDGNHYQIATHIEDLTPAEIGQRMKGAAQAAASA